MHDRKFEDPSDDEPEITREPRIIDLMELYRLGYQFERISSPVVNNQESVNSA